MTDFSDRTFVAGSLFGLRSFKTDSLARLTGVTVPQVWTPGENLAECKRPDNSGMNAMWSLLNGGSLRFTSTPATTPGPLTPSGGMRYDAKKHRYEYDPTAGRPVVSRQPVEPPAPPKHDLVSLACTCGFYAYFDGSNEYAEDAGTLGITGIVEGYGKAVVGDRGFRAEKARIVALVAPDFNGLGSHSAQVLLRWQRVAEMYGVPMYGSAAQAVEAHPLSEHLSPSPETDDDFWTRSAS